MMYYELKDYLPELKEWYSKLGKRIKQLEEQNRIVEQLRANGGNAERLGAENDTLDDILCEIELDVKGTPRLKDYE